MYKKCFFDIYYFRNTSIINNILQNMYFSNLQDIFLSRIIFIFYNFFIYLYILKKHFKTLYLKCFI